MAEIRMRILAIDPGDTMGWAMLNDGLLHWGTVSHKENSREHPGQRFCRFMNWIEAAFAQLDPGGPEMVTYEEALTLGYYAARMNFGYSALIEAKAAKHMVPTHAVKASQLKRFATNRGTAKKPLMIAAAADRVMKLTGNRPELTDHEADALWLLWYGLEHYAA